LREGGFDGDFGMLMGCAAGLSGGVRVAAVEHEEFLEGGDVFRGGCAAKDGVEGGVGIGDEADVRR
jgi:hypothetical protein